MAAATTAPRLRTVTVSLPNKPGALAAAGRTLADAKINLEGVEAEILGTHGFFRFHTPESERAVRLLVQKGFICTVSEILEVVLTDRPGELARLWETLAAAKINVESCFGSTETGARTARFFLRVSDSKKAQQLVAKFLATT